ncbi:T. brucei spp.-specific protein [Trypanosoma brucei gambiense DAL972]|uniref:T. brucei spp.-specific protein n=2 Tax=Trypanosoma brucei TaxID=5691 RepID=C9ZJR4_TRYB9|nr:T. brucei spp.-specific protein [Trypanosoma brucei gambiense DAL972]RHW74025.1 small nuclear RNA [Trypanosoma brucei equiperdum]CBH09624.1 T. brucei spp.-specific protein [Trypanosoma brucei gambiense DAL972]|eukprot:XP_011771928.1 T. brucei spp.-specific protein [Trypanosoma brucei gambiense DAL972]
MPSPSHSLILHWHSFQPRFHTGHGSFEYNVGRSAGGMPLDSQYFSHTRNAAHLETPSTLFHRCSFLYCAQQCRLVGISLHTLYFHHLRLTTVQTVNATVLKGAEGKQKEIQNSGRPRSRTQRFKTPTKTHTSIYLYSSSGDQRGVQTQIK